MTVGVSKNWLLSIRNAAMQHLLLSQRHQKFPYSQRNGYNPFPMTLGVTLNNLPGCAAAGTADGQFTSTGYVPPLQGAQFTAPQPRRNCQRMLGGLDTPTKGSVTLAGKDLYRMKEDALAVFRRRKIGFVFQAFNLVSSVNVWENIVLPLGLDGRKVDEAYTLQTI